MSQLRFSGGYPIQRGRGMLMLMLMYTWIHITSLLTGIGGLLRTVVSFLKPVAKTIGKSAVKVAKSDTAKMLGNSLKEQAINTALNLTSNAIKGNDLNESLKSELASTRNTIGDSVEGVRSNLLKRKGSQEKSGSIKRVKVNNKKIKGKKAKKKNDYIWEK